MNNKELTELYHEQFNRIKELEAENAALKRDLSDSSAEIVQCHVEIEALRQEIAELKRESIVVALLKEPE